LAIGDLSDEPSLRKAAEGVDGVFHMSKALGRKIEAGEINFDEWARAAKIPDGPVKDGLRIICTGPFSMFGGRGLQQRFA
jgi:hypothetical protein